MIPGMNPRQMRQMMQKMGVQQQEIEATEVVIRTADGKEIYFESPQVSAVNMMGQKTYQIVGVPKERSIETKAEISEDDIKTVMDQAECSEEDAKSAIEAADGDLAEAILSFQSE